MKTHIIDNGTVTNTIMATVAEAQAIYPQSTCIEATDGGIGWTWDGDKLIPPPAPPVPVPKSITRRQGKIILSRNGILAAVEAYILSMEGQAGEEARIDWVDASEWDRGWPLLDQVATGFGLTSEQIDQMFIDASAL